MHAQHEIADPTEPSQRLRATSELDGEQAHLATTSRDKQRQGRLAEAEACRGASSDSQWVLERAADLDADNVGGCVWEAEKQRGREEERGRGGVVEGKE